MLGLGLSLAENALRNRQVGSDGGDDARVLTLNGKTLTLNGKRLVLNNV